MAVFTVNGQKVEPTGNQKLLRFLRDELHLTSVKDGCSEGACGACTVIIDGKTCKACVPDTDLLDGRTVITVEGLTEWEREVYTYAYGKENRPAAHRAESEEVQARGTLLCAQRARGVEVQVIAASGTRYGGRDG